MNEEILKKLEALIERAIDRATSNIECRGGGLDGKDLYAEVEVITSLISALKMLAAINEKRTVFAPEMSVDVSSKAAKNIVRTEEFKKLVQEYKDTYPRKKFDAPQPDVSTGRILDLKSGSADCNPPYYVTARLAAEIVAKATKTTLRQKRNIREDRQTAVSSASA